MKPRIWIGKLLWCGAASLGVAFLAGMLSVVLRSLGDGAAAEAVHGVTLVALGIFVLTVVTLVVMLAVIELNRDNSPPNPG